MTTLAAITAAPILLRVGQRSLLASPLTFRDIGAYSLYAEDGESDRKSVAYLVWLSVRRQHPGVSFSWVYRKLRSRRRCNRAFSRLAHLNPTVFHSVEEEESSERDRKEAAEIASTIFRLFSDLFSWTPTQIASMTPEQVLSLMTRKAGDKLPRWKSVAEWREWAKERGTYPEGKK